MNGLCKARVTTSLQCATFEHKRNSCQVLKKLKPWAPPPYVVRQMTSKTFSNMYKKMAKGRVAVGWPLRMDLRWSTFQETATQRQKHHAPSWCCCFLLKLQINKVRYEVKSCYGCKNDIVNAMETLDSYKSVQLCQKSDYTKDFFIPFISVTQQLYCAWHEKHSGTVKWANQQWRGQKYTPQCILTNAKTKKNIETVGGLNIHFFWSNDMPLASSDWMSQLCYYYTSATSKQQRSNSATPCGIRFFNHTWQANTVFSHNSSKPALVCWVCIHIFIKKQLDKAATAQGTGLKEVTVSR